MKKELKDFLYLYPGVTLLCPDDDGRLFECYKWHIDSNGNLDVDGYLFDWNDDPKPILRHLSDMTEDEKKKYYTIKGKNAFNPHEPYSTLFLLAYHFDLFDLIPSGLAIDATTLKETNPAT